MIQKIPHDSLVLYHLAKTMRKKGMMQEARTTLEQAVQHCSFSNDKTKYQKCLSTWPKR